MFLAGLTACDILFERIATYARLSASNQAACILPSLPYLSRISAIPDCRPGHPHKRAPRSFLFFRPLLLRQFPHLVSADRRPDLYHLPRRVDLPGRGTHRRPAAALPPPDAGGAGRPAKPPPHPILPTGPGKAREVQNHKLAPAQHRVGLQLPMSERNRLLLPARLHRRGTGRCGEMLRNGHPAGSVDLGGVPGRPGTGLL